MMPRLPLPKLLVFTLVSLIIRESSLCWSFPVAPLRRVVAVQAGLAPSSRNLPHQQCGVVLSATTVGKSQSELVIDDDDEGEEEDDWIPDREKAKQKRLKGRILAERVAPSSANKEEIPDSRRHRPRPDPDPEEPLSSRKSPYTEDEEDIIAAMGGKTFHRERRREEGFLGDSTLEEIAQDYSIPICYMADVLCLWGVSPPINPKDRLGDLVTGEQAFALLEAVNSLDVSQVQDRYSIHNLLTLCDEWDIDLQTAFEFAVKEGWSLPFGVQTHLRIEQEDELLRVHGAV